MTPPRWPHVRAALLAVVVIAHGLVALPIGPKVTAKSIAEPAAQAEVDAWMKLAGPLGFSREGFVDTVITWSDRLVTWDAALTAPFKPPLKLTRTGQGWALFAAPDLDPLRLEVRGTDGAGATRVLFRRLDPAHRWRHGVFDFRRVRGVYDLTTKGMPPRYVNFTRWVADRAFEDFDDLVRVDVVQVESRSTLPWQPPDPSTRERYAQSHERPREATPVEAP